MHVHLLSTRIQLGYHTAADPLVPRDDDDHARKKINTYQRSIVPLEGSGATDPRDLSSALDCRWSVPGHVEKSHPETAGHITLRLIWIADMATKSHGY